MLTVYLQWIMKAMTVITVTINVKSVDIQQKVNNGTERTI